MTYDERKQLLFRRIKNDLPSDLLVNQGDVMPLSENIPNVPFNIDLNQYLDDLLLISKEIILNERYPFSDQIRPSDVEPQFEMLQVQIAIELFNKEGSEGAKSHSENGISVSYSSADISDDLRSRILPLCGVL